MYKLIASDMDETFMSSDHQLVQKNLDAIAQLKEKGVFFVPTSGRPYWSILESFGEHKHLLDGSYIISLNGGVINKVGHETPLRVRALDLELVQELFELGVSEGFGLHVYEAAGDIWVYNVPQSEIEWLGGHPKFHVLKKDSLAELEGRPVAKILFLKPDVDYLMKLKPQMMGKYPQTKVTISSNRYIEFNPQGVDKGHAVQELANSLNIEINEVIGVGDSLNDEDMLRMVGMGLAVQNASDYIKSVAKEVLPASCDDGVIDSIYQLYIK